MAGKQGARSEKPAAPSADAKPDAVQNIAALDGRRRYVRLHRQAVADMSSDLGGAENLSHVQRALVERAASIELWQMMFETRLLNGEPIADQVGAWLQSVNTGIGLARTLGLRRHARELGLKDVLEGDAQ